MKLALKRLPFNVVPYELKEIKSVIIPLITASTPGAVSLGMTAVVIHSGNAGTGYTAGDIAAVVNTGATDSVAATINILTVNGSGVPLTISINNAGRYTVLPTTYATSVTTTGGTGTGFEADITWGVVFAAVSGGAGTAYVAPTVTFSAGAATGTAVLTNGVVSSITITAAGTYTTSVPTYTLTYTTNTAQLAKFTIGLNQVLVVNARWKGGCKASGHVYYVEEQAVFKNVAGTTTQVGSTVSTGPYYDVSTWGVAWSVSSPSILATATGSQTEIVEWDGAITTTILSINT